ncbi:MAG: hypothetical protein KKD39_05220 [Candidatus Altiarchaeota archaeon]|nr:hypothetical protein [Candidatus Altiarchaeota archaeon]
MKNKNTSISFEYAITVAIFVLIYAYLLTIFPSDLLLMQTTTSGGDTASHYYPTKYLRDELIPRGRITGWMPGWYGGIPLFQFYFPLMFVLIALGSYIIPLEIAFKLGTVVSVFIMPAGFFFGMKYMGYKYPAPQLAALFSLPYLFMENNVMWAGNIPSILAGLFSHTTSIPLMVLGFGTIAYGVKNNRLTTLNIILISTIAMLHVYSLLPITFASAVLFFLVKKPAAEKIRYFMKIYLTAFLLVGFWLIPMLLNLGYTTSFSHRYIITEDIISPLIWPLCIVFSLGIYLRCETSLKKVLFALFVVLILASVKDSDGLDYRRHIDSTAWIGKIAAYFYGDSFFGRNIILFAAFPLIILGYAVSKGESEKYLYLLMLMAFFFFNIGIYIQIMGIRFMPVIYMGLMLLTASYLSDFLKNIKERNYLILAIVLVTILWVNDVNAILRNYIQKSDSLVTVKNDIFDEIADGEYEGYSTTWIKDNYAGFEGKKTWDLFKEINDFVSGDASDPRVVYEHNTRNTKFGSVRAFESLPLFSGRSTLEGLYFQSAVTVPFVFYIQSEIGEQQSCPFGQIYPCTRFNLTNGVERMKLFNVEYYLAVSTKAKKAAKQISDLRLVRTFENYEVYRIEGYKLGYVSVPEYKPVIFHTNNWKNTSYQWFTRVDLLDVPLLFPNRKDEVEDMYLAGLEKTSSLEDLKRIPTGAECSISESFGFEELNFTTDCIGQPHIIKMTYYPNWMVEGARKVYLVSPSFMLVYPEQNFVRIYYGKTWVDYLGYLATVTGAILLISHRRLPV